VAGIGLASIPRMAPKTTPATHEARADREEGTRPDGEAMPPAALDPQPTGDPSELDDPMAGSPDKEAGPDNRRQRPITDNKAGG